MTARTVLAAAAAFAVLAGPAGAQVARRTITHDDVFTMKRTGRPIPSPDGRWIVFSVVEPSYDPARTASDLWIATPDGRSAPRRLTATRGAESGASWSPDSRAIAFSARREGDEAEQIYVLPLEGGEARRLTSHPGGASNPKWRPDGRAILFEGMVTPARADPGMSSARVFDAMPIRYWNTWLDGSRPHLFVQPIDGGAPADWLAGTRLADAPGFDAPYAGEGASRSLNAVWAPGGDEIVFSAVVNRDAMMHEVTETHLFRVREGAEPVQLTSRGVSVDEAAFLPDGSALVALLQKSASADRLYRVTRLVRLAWPSGAATPLTDGFDRSVGAFAVGPDGESIVFSAEDEGFTQLFRVPARGGTVRRLFQVQAGNYSAPAFAGTTLVALYGSSVQPNEVARVDEAGGSHRLISDFNRTRLDELDLPAPEHFWFTAGNGRRIHSVIWFPPGLDRARRYPLIVNPHGGPNAMSSDGFSTRWNYHLLTSPGYVLLATNYTGSTGFGEQFADDIERDVLRGPAAELLEAAEEAMRRYPFIDRTRQAAVGASYGGYLVNWLNGHTDQFRAIVSHAGAVNNASQYGANDGGLTRELRMGALPWELEQGQWLEQSPFRYAARWKTPVLITQGELDFRVPLNESMTTFKLLQRQKVPARLVTYPDEGHWILKGENSRHHMQEVLNWLRKYLEPPPGS